MSKTLSRADWIQHATKMLTENGYTALRAQPLAKSLGVSRGSFYWHFADIAALEAAVLRSWSRRSTDIVIRRLGQEAPAIERLASLIHQAFESEMGLERAIRSWAIASPAAHKAVSAVDRRRLDYIAQLLSEIGVADAEIRSRALMLYWSSLGRLMIANSALRKMSDAEIANMVELITARD